MFRVLRRGVAARVGRVGDDHDLIGIGADRIGSGAGEPALPIVIGDLIGAGRAGDAHIDVAGGAAAIGRAGDIGLIPLDHDGDEVARDQRGDRHRQARSPWWSPRGIEVQQILAAVRSRGRNRGERRRGIFVGQRAIVARQRKNTRRPAPDHGVDGLRHDAVLEERLIEVAHVVGDDLGAGAAWRDGAASLPMPVAKSASLFSAV